MNTKSTLIAIALLAAGLFAYHSWYGNYREQVGVDKTVATLTQDSTVVTSDTVWVVADTVIKYEWLIIKEADTDTIEDIITYSTHIDTALVINKDTVAVINQDISLTEGIFETLMKIEIRPVEKIINVIKTEFRTVIKEVRISSFPNTFLTGFISMVILVMGFLIALL